MDRCSGGGVGGPNPSFRFASIYSLVLPVSFRPVPGFEGLHFPSLYGDLMVMMSVRWRICWFFLGEYIEEIVVFFWHEFCDCLVFLWFPFFLRCGCSIIVW